MREALRFATGFVLGMLVAAVIWMTAQERPQPAVVLRSPPTPWGVTVHVVGAVASPGVYTLPDGARVVDAVEAAGGFLETADQTALNLATRLEDGQQVIVFSRASLPAQSRLDINRATVDQLDALPGLSRTVAENIVAYRQVNGFFTSVEDLLNVTGVGASTLDAIRDWITVKP